MVDIDRSAELVREGINNPKEIPPYVLKKLFPRKFSPKRIDGNVVTWNTNAGFGWGDGDDPPQVSAINYHMVQALRTDLSGNNYRHAVEIGCGYGRVTPWLTEFANEVTGIDPNENVLSIVDNYYPKVNVLLSKAQDIPMEDNEADLVFTRSVLQHIPPDEIKKVVREIKRISDSNADLLICEATTGLKKNAFYPRSVDDYSNLFDTFNLENSWQRKAPAKSRKNTRTRMKFNNA